MEAAPLANSTLGEIFGRYLDVVNFSLEIDMLDISHYARSRDKDSIGWDLADTSRQTRAECPKKFSSKYAPSNPRSTTVCCPQSFQASGITCLTLLLSPNASRSEESRIKSAPGSTGTRPELKQWEPRPIQKKGTPKTLQRRSPRNISILEPFIMPGEEFVTSFWLAESVR